MASHQPVLQSFRLSSQLALSIALMVTVSATVTARADNGNFTDTMPVPVPGQFVQIPLPDEPMELHDKTIYPGKIPAKLTAKTPASHPGDVSKLISKTPLPPANISIIKSQKEKYAAALASATPVVKAPVQEKIAVPSNSLNPANPNNKIDIVKLGSDTIQILPPLKHTVAEAPVKPVSRHILPPIAMPMFSEEESKPTPATQSAPGTPSSSNLTKPAQPNPSASTQTISQSNLSPTPLPVSSPEKPDTTDSSQTTPSPLPAGDPHDVSAPLKIGLNSKRVPAGTFLKIAFNSAMDSRITEPGEPFTALLTDDFIDKNNPGPASITRVILPAGTMIRGRVEQVKRPGFFSQGGSIYLTFDHVVSPAGDQWPLDLKLSTDTSPVVHANNLAPARPVSSTGRPVQTTQGVNQQGALYSDPGIQNKLKKSLDNGITLVQKITKMGVDAGKQTADGWGQIITVPAAAVGGVLAGTAVTTGQGVSALVGKGESVVIKPGDTVTIDFGGSFALPTE